ncbi:hypothetical protein INR49_018150, partial [Caranx melampygus]
MRVSTLPKTHRGWSDLLHKILCVWRRGVSGDSGGGSQERTGLRPRELLPLGPAVAVFAL